VILNIYYSRNVSPPPTLRRVINPNTRSGNILRVLQINAREYACTSIRQEFTIEIVYVRLQARYYRQKTGGKCLNNWNARKIYNENCFQINLARDVKIVSYTRRALI